MSAKRVVVYVGRGMLEAETVRLFLESNEIPAYVSQESAGVTFGLTVGPLGEARVMVDEADQPRALQVLKAMEAGEFVLPGEDVDPGYDEEADEDAFGDEEN